MNEKKARLYTTVFCQCYSPCGKYLAAGDNCGEIAVYSLQTALSPEITNSTYESYHKFKGHNGAIYSLQSTDQHLISAGSGDIRGWSWADIITKVPKVIWIISLPTESRFESPETNSLVVSTNKDTGDSRLFAGCGDKQIYMWDIETSSLLLTLKGHQDYIHQVALRSGGQEILSASEDGTARVWDTRSSREAIQIIEPFKNDNIARPHLGKSLKCLAVDDCNEWMLCGGGPHLSLWHLRSLTPTEIYKTKDNTHHTVRFYKDLIFSGGSDSSVCHWSLDGTLKNKISCNPTTIFSIASNDSCETYKILSVAGTSNKIDVFTNPGYRAFSLNFR